MGEVVQRVKRFSKYPDSCIILGVPIKKFFTTNVPDGLRYEKKLDVIIESYEGIRDIGYMPSSDNMRWFDREFPSFKRISYRNKRILGGELL